MATWFCLTWSMPCNRSLAMASLVYFAVFTLIHLLYCTDEMQVTILKHSRSIISVPGRKWYWILRVNHFFLRKVLERASEWESYHIKVQKPLTKNKCCALCFQKKAWSPAIQIQLLQYSFRCLAVHTVERFRFVLHHWSKQPTEVDQSVFHNGSSNFPLSSRTE